MWELLLEEAIENKGSDARTNNIFRKTNTVSCRKSNSVEYS